MGQLKSKIIFLRGLACLKEIVNEGSISKAAEQNGYQQSNLSRIIKNLESSFATKLLEKSSGGVVLTSFGKSLMQYVNQIDVIFNQINYNFCKYKNELSDIRIWIEDGFANYYTSRCLQYFTDIHDGIRVELMTTGERVKTLNGIDLAFVHDKNPMRFLGEKVIEHSFKSYFWASKSYIEKYGKPKDLDDLFKNHKICMRRESLLWDDANLIIEKSKHLFVMVESTSLLVALVRQGVGIALMPEWMKNDNSDFVSLDYLNFDVCHKIFGVVNKNLPHTTATDLILKAVLKTFDVNDESSCKDVKKTLE